MLEYHIYLAIEIYKVRKTLDYLWSPVINFLMVTNIIILDVRTSNK